MKLTVSEFNSLRYDYAGYCESCKQIGRECSTEPDAEGYECEICGENACMGMENAMIFGLIDIIEEEEIAQEAICI